MNTTVVVLKPRHSLVGRSLTPLMLDVNKLEGELLHTLCRLKKDHNLDSYTYEELENAFKKLTWEDAKTIMMLSGRVFPTGIKID